jgi:hypothetical protein
VWQIRTARADPSPWLPLCVADPHRPYRKTGSCGEYL